MKPKLFDVGTVVEVYNNGEAYEIEFTDQKGKTIEVVTLWREYNLSVDTSSPNSGTHCYGNIEHGPEPRGSTFTGGELYTEKDFPVFPFKTREAKKEAG